MLEIYEAEIHRHFYDFFGRFLGKIIKNSTCVNLKKTESNFLKIIWHFFRNIAISFEDSKV